MMNIIRKMDIAQKASILNNAKMGQWMVNRMPDDKKYYLVNSKTGDVYGKSGSFGAGVPMPFKTVLTAFKTAQQLADYYRFEVRVDDQDGNEVCSCVPKGR